MCFLSVTFAKSCNVERWPFLVAASSPLYSKCLRRSSTTFRQYFRAPLHLQHILVSRIGCLLRFSAFGQGKHRMQMNIEHCCSKGVMWNCCNFIAMTINQPMEPVYLSRHYYCLNILFRVGLLPVTIWSLELIDGLDRFSVSQSSVTDAISFCWRVVAIISTSLVATDSWLPRVAAWRAQLCTDPETFTWLHINTTMIRFRSAKPSYLRRPNEHYVPYGLFFVVITLRIPCSRLSTSQSLCN